MATITQPDGRGGITLPVWFLTVMTAAMLALLLTVGGTVIKTWASTENNSEKNVEQDGRLGALERSQLDMGAMKADISNMKDMQKTTNDKLDRLLEVQFGRRER